MTDMKMTKQEAKEQYGSPSAVNDYPQYPYGLRLDLDGSSIKKLGLDKLPDTGTTMIIVARVEVCSTSEYQTMGNETERRLGLQIVEMDLAKDTEKSDKATELYG